MLVPAGVGLNQAPEGQPELLGLGDLLASLSPLSTGAQQWQLGKWPPARLGLAPQALSASVSFF